jgi:putative DNA primase/helicase
MQLIPQAIPPELRATPRWIVWKVRDRDGKPDKPPFDYRTGRPGDVTDPAVWLPFDGAIKLIGRFDGIGFAFSPRDDFAGIDLDHCIDEDGNLEPWAERIVDGLQSYTERSPSGRGLHVLIRGKLPPEARRNKMGGYGADGSGVVEMYDHARYFTVTGDHWDGTPEVIHDRGEELAAFYREIFPEGAKKGENGVAHPRPHDLSDDAILERARRAWNGEKFRDLFDSGDTSRYHGDDSRADLALCSHLAFWAGGATDVIDRLFRESALFRPKWDEARGQLTYGERTINKALEGMRAFYDPTARKPPREPGEDDAAEGEDLAPVNRTDLGNARRLVRTFGDDLRYCHPWGKWLAWTGDHWQVDETGAVYRNAREVIAQLHAEAAEADDDAVHKALAAWALASESEKRINSMVSLARQEPGIPILPGALDAWPWLLNCPNGTADLRSGKLGPHVKGDHLMKRTDTPLDPDAKCPLWDDFLRKVMGEDQELIDFLRRAVGYAITADITEHVLFFLYGRGRNGKSTFLNTLIGVLGDYAITINAELLATRPQDEHPTAMADLQGRRFVATSEVEDGRRMAESLVKKLTGGERIRARKMRQDFYEFDPTHTLFLAANHKPTVRGTDEGIWRRIKLVPFAVQIPPEEVDRSLPLKLKAEAAGILAWAVRGCIEWQAGGLAEPAAVTSATDEYRSEMDVFAGFLAEKCFVADGVRAKSGDLYLAYTGWCRETGNVQLSSNKFGRLLTERGFGSEKANSTAWRLGVGLLEAPKPEVKPKPETEEGPAF